jgi:hypothetical protein
MLFLACLSRSESRGIMMAVPSLSWKNVAYYLDSFKDMNMKLGMFAYHDKVQLLDKGHHSESYFIGLCPFLT